MTKKLVESEGARNVAVSKTDPTTRVTTTVRVRRRPWLTLSVIRVLPPVPLRVCTRPPAGVRAMLCGLKHCRDGGFKAHRLVAQKIVDSMVVHNDLVAHRVDKRSSCHEVDIGDEAQPMRGKPRGE